MANTLLTPDMITSEALRILHQKLNFIGNINRAYDSSFAKDGAKIGDSLRIRLPNEYVVRSGAALSAQDTTEQSITLQINNQKGVDLNFTSTEMTLDLDNFGDRVLKPAMSKLAAHIESDMLANVYKDIYQQVNNQGAAMTFNKAGDAHEMLMEALSPPDMNMILNPRDNNDYVKDTKALFNDSAELSRQYREGKVGKAQGFDIWQSTYLPSHTVGAGYLINGASQSGSALTVDTGTGAVKAGDVFTIAGVYRVHPETKIATGDLQQFVITSDATSGATSLSISPAIVTSGARQNVSAAPADNAAITFAGTASTAHKLSLAFHKDAFTFATADLVMPKGVDMGARKSYDGISLRLIRDYDISTDKFLARFDVLYGYKTLRPQLAVRLANN